VDSGEEYGDEHTGIPKLKIGVEVSKWGVGY
jgi:hypothetical protein